MPFRTLREALIELGFDHKTGVVCLQWLIEFKEDNHKPGCDNLDGGGWCPCLHKERRVKRIIPWEGKWCSKLLDTSLHSMTGGMSWAILEWNTLPENRHRSIELDFVADDKEAVYTLGSYDGDQWVQKVLKNTEVFCAKKEVLHELVIDAFRYEGIDK